MSTTREYPALLAAFNAESWQYLQDEWPDMADALAVEVGRGAGYVHFRVQIDGRMYHRLAQITKAAQVPTPATRPAKKEPPLPLFEQRQEDWLP